MTDQLNWGILATGMIARKFAQDLPGSQTGRLVAVGSRTLASAEKFAADFGGGNRGRPGGVRAHGSYEALLADPAVQAVYIAPPHPQHLEWAVRAAEAGKHILCEKPLTLRRADTERMIAAARQHDVLLMEAYMYRLHPQTRKLVELVRSGAIGELRLIRASFNVLAGFDPAHRLFKKELGGGAILDLGGYPVSFARLIAGAALDRTFAEPEKFLAAGRLHPQAGTDEFATAVAAFPGGVVAELSCGTTIVNDHSAEIHGTRGWIEVPNPFTPGLLGQTEKIIVHRQGGASETVKIKSPDRGLYAYEADAVAGALARGERAVPELPWADSLGIAGMLDAWLAAVGVSYEGV
jgi:predicted dehydrogenase